MKNSSQPFSIVYQITQECPFECGICHRRYESKEETLSTEKRNYMVDILKEQNIGRLTVTGGEPTILGDDLFNFLKYIHTKKIHSCLTTTGFRLTKAKFDEMEEYLDQMMISIRSLDQTNWIKEFGNTRYTHEIFNGAVNLLNWAKSTNIIFEVCTVAHKENVDSILELGWQLLRINPNINWRVDEYYGMGIQSALRDKYELVNNQFTNIRNQISKTFSNRFRNLRFTTKEQRISSPEFLITHSGELVTSSNHLHTPTGVNILNTKLNLNFKMLRTWAELRTVCRDWGWGDFDGLQRDDKYT